tara:strand:- start:190 stop:339 length:150 start_codon:yes stop_codon:yes gene_type:complete
VILIQKFLIEHQSLIKLGYTRAIITQEALQQLSKQMIIEKNLLKITLAL